MAIGIGIGIPFRRILNNTPALPTGLSASFTVDTISGDLTWTDNSGGKAQYEVYSSTNGGAYTLLTTTAIGATSYSDTTCRQNASVVYRIRAKKGGTYSEYAATSAINTPLCFKTNQSTLTTVTINTLYISSGSVTIDWGDGNSNTYSGNNLNITYNYATTGQKNISFSGNINHISSFSCNSQPSIYGDISNWVLPSNLLMLLLNSTGITGTLPYLPNTLSVLQVQFTTLSGDISNIIVPASCTFLYLYTDNFTGKTPQIIDHPTNGLNYRISTNNLSGTNTTVFRKAMTNFDISNQKVVFPTIEVDKFFKAAADWYQVNAPTANCTYNLSGANMGIPTGGTANVDIVRLIGYYSAAGFAATVLVRTN